MRLDSVTIENFRCFRRSHLDFHPALNVLVAPNGGGKTAVLDACAALLRPLLDSFGANPTVRLMGSDIHRVRSEQSMELRLPCRLSLAGTISGQRFASGTRVTSLRQVGPGALILSGTSSDDSLEAAAEGLRRAVQDSAEDKAIAPPVLPLLAYYGSARTQIRLNEPDAASNPPTSRLSAYQDCLRSTASYQIFLDWFERFSREAQDARATGRETFPDAETRLSSIREAIDIVLRPSKWHSVEWDFVERGVVATHPEFGRLPVSSLADGIREMILIAGDMAHRAVRLNPHLGAQAVRRTPGVILIDEIDHHLHPSWQQVIVDALKAAFPEIQLILTTHSPHVLSTIRAESIRIIEPDGQIAVPAEETRGVESATVLATVMGVNPTPAVEEARLLSNYRALIEDAQFDTPEARSLRQKLDRHFGERHQLMLDCDTLIRFQRFKEKLPPSSASHPAGG